MPEPIMRVEILVPDEFTGDVISDLNARQGKIEQITTRGRQGPDSHHRPFKDVRLLHCPSSSVSQGRATFTMQFSHYDRM